MNSITFTLTADDLITAQRLYQSNGLKRYAMIVAFMVIAAVWLMVASDGILDWQLMAIPLGVLLVIIIFNPVYARYWGIPRMAKRAMVQDPLMAKPSTLQWDDKMARVDAEGASWENPIADFAGWQANEDILLLYRQIHLFHLIPTRAFPDAATRQSLIDALVANGVSNKWPMT